MVAAYLRAPEVQPVREAFAPCHNKQTFGSASAARVVASRLRFGSDVYHCRACGRFHVGQSAPVTAAHERMGLIRPA